jgi:peptidoglycan/xylan/chitin deacetylase (PgdA/CDA1 family)
VTGALRGFVKGLARRPWAAVARYALRWTGLRAGLVLVYHHVTPDPAAGPVGPVQVTSSDDFAAQMRHLRRAYRVVRAAEMVEAAAGRRRGARFPVAVTFDDDLSSHARVVMPVLVDLNVPATFFVGGRGLAPARELWWETLERGLDAGLAEEVARGLGIPRPAGPGAQETSVAWDIAGHLLDRSPDEREDWRRALESRLGGAAKHDHLTRSQLRSLVEAGFELGFHTLGHENLIQLDDAQLSRALTDGRDALRDVAGHALTALAYPYGRADERVSLAARRHGFERGFTSREECVTPWADPMRIGRVEPAARSGAGFALELTRRLGRSPSSAGEDR